MRNRINVWIMLAVVGLVLEGWALHVIGVSAERWRPAMIVKDEPVAHALYEAMLTSVRDATSLSYTSICRGPDGRASAYRVWLKKPNYFRVELVNGLSHRRTMLVGDGEHLWIYWLGDRPFLSTDDANGYERTRSGVYVKKAIRREDSIGNEMARLGVAWYAVIFDPGVFHGHSGFLGPYLDGVRARGTDGVGGEKCDVIEVSYMHAQRTRYFWLSRRDHLPRKMKEIVRLTDNRVNVEEWSDVTINTEAPKKRFAWSPPESWREWDLPEPEDFLLESGQEAPDFELFSSHEKTIRLSEYRGKVVWLYMWQVGSPRCRQEMPHLQSLYEEYRDRGLVVLGLNLVDDNRIARRFIRDNEFTFPIVLEPSATTERVLVQDYGNKMEMVPLSYIISREGKVVDAWYGYDQGHDRAMAALEKAEVRLEER